IGKPKRPATFAGRPTHNPHQATRRLRKPPRFQGKPTVTLPVGEAATGDSIVIQDLYTPAFQHLMGSRPDTRKERRWGGRMAFEPSTRSSNTTFCGGRRTFE